jgi:hypothetical protein
MSNEGLRNIKEIRALEIKYGYVPFCMGLTHLFDSGVSNFNDAFVEEGFKAILAEEEQNKIDGKTPFMTANFKREILRCSAELAKYEILMLFAYIKKHITVDI